MNIRNSQGRADEEMVLFWGWLLVKKKPVGWAEKEETPSNKMILLLMVQKSGEHQLRLVVYPIIYDGFYTSQVVQDFFHQQ